MKFPQVKTQLSDWDEMKADRAAQSTTQQVGAGSLLDIKLVTSMLTDTVETALEMGISFDAILEVGQLFFTLGEEDLRQWADQKIKDLG